MNAMTLCVMNTAGRNAAIVANAIYTSLAGMGISYPQMACVMGVLVSSGHSRPCNTSCAMHDRVYAYVYWCEYTALCLYNKEESA